MDAVKEVEEMPQIHFIRACEDGVKGNRKLHTHFFFFGKNKDVVADAYRFEQSDLLTVSDQP